MGFEDLALLMPGILVDGSIVAQTFYSGLRHEDCVMRVVVYIESLAAEAQ